VAYSYFINRTGPMTTFTPSTSPIALRAYALEHNISSTRGTLTVTCDGMFVIKGRRATLNEAIMACGRYDLSLA
jgi:hypothetical protein